MSAFSVGSTTPTEDRATKAKSTPDESSGPGSRFVKWIPGDAIVFYTAILALQTTREDDVVAVAGPVVESDPEVGADDAAGDQTAVVEVSRDELREIDASSFSWFAFALVVAIGFVLIGANNQSRSQGQDRVTLKKLLAVRCLLAGVAFILWSSLIPSSWTNNLSIVQDMGDAYVIVVGVVATAFTAVATSVTKRFGGS